MSIDGFHSADKDAFTGYESRVASPFYRAVVRRSPRLHVTVEGLQNIPKGRALLVGNHAFGWDSMLPIAAMSTRLGRRVWVLGDHAWWRIPFVRRLASAVGVVDGTQDNVTTLLDRDELVLVLPGGLREAVKPRELRYQLLWGQRYGFVRAALQCKAPMVPLASVGTDELFDFVGNAYQRGRRWFHRSSIPIPLPARLLPIPHLVQLRFRVGEPIPYPEGATPDDFKLVRRLRREAEGALHELIERELAARCGIELD